MKFFIAVLFALIALATAKRFEPLTSKDLTRVRKECIKTNNVTAGHNKKFDNWQFPDDDTTRCYIKCILEKFELFDDNDGFKVNNLVSQLGQSKANKGEVKTKIEKCNDKNEQKSDPCTRAYRGFVCFVSKHLSLIQKSFEKD